MRSLLFCFVLVLTAGLSCSRATAYTLTFDDVPSGTILRYSPVYYNSVSFSDEFQVADDTLSTLGPAHSEPNVAIWTGDAHSDFARVLFGRYDSSSEATPYPVASLSAYFGTTENTVVRLTAYNWIAPNTLIQVASVDIGRSGESWVNRLVDLGSLGSSFNTVIFSGISGDGLRGFYMNDLTVTPVPEPSACLALLAGLSGVGGLALRRRKA